MIAAIPRFFEFYSNFLIESLTALRKQGLLYTEIGNLKPMLSPQPITPLFKFVSPEGLPGNAVVQGFRPERYNWTSRAGPVDEIEIAELLVSLVAPDGTPISNQAYFEAVHAAGRSAEVDALIIPAGIDFAFQNGLIGNNQVIAMNMFQASATFELFDNVYKRLAKYQLCPDDVMIELLEYKTEITQEQIDAVAYGHELGLGFALDDIDPRDPHDRERVAKFAPYCNVLKIKREVMEELEQGTYPRAQFEEDVAALAGNHNVLIVAEGITRALHSRMPFIVSATQSMWGELPPPTGK